MVPAASDGLYDSRFEHDACGVGFVADLAARGGHDVVASALRVLCNLEHRGAAGADPDTGDGAGILTQLPHAFFREVTGFSLPQAGGYAAGLAFLPIDAAERADVCAGIADLAQDEGLTVLGWRDVPVNESACGAGAREALPYLAQLFVAGEAGETGLTLDRMAFCLRKRAEHGLAVYFASLSSRTIVYKGMLSAPQVGPFFPDLSDERFASNLALVHSRFSTNTFPSWPRSHPYRYVAHNGEINTVQGNRNWMRAREAMLDSPLIPVSKSGQGIERLFPIIDPEGSDSGSFDECLELLHLGGRSLPHALLMMIPEPWENHDEMDVKRRAFYQFHSTLMEPWDGPALIAFTDGDVIGAVLDRNGLRPGRYWVTSDGLVVLASEVGVLDIEPARVVRRGRLQPGRIFLVDTAAGRLIEDEEVKTELAADHPYADWLHAGLVHLDDLPDRERQVPTAFDLLTRQRAYGYTEEELRLILSPMARTGAEPIGSMGTDTPVAVLSDKPRLVFDYFTQLFAQVTNPPLDAIREELVTSLSTTTGPEQNLLEPSPASCRQIVLPFPVIGEQDLAKLVHINDEGNLPGFAGHVIDGRFDPAGGGEGLRRRLAEICAEVSAVIESGARLIVLSDRDSLGTGLVPIPSLLLTGAVHHHLIREKTRTRVGLIIESGDARECHHVALLAGYGGAAVCPYLAIETVRELAARGELGAVTPDKAEANLIKALGKGVLKIMSKMGVSTIASYTGAQIFEAIGLGDDVIATCFRGTSSRLGGVGFDVLAQEAARRAAVGRGGPGLAHRQLETGGEYQWRREGEPHLFNPETVFKLQHATRSRRYEIFKEYTALVDDQAAKLATLRGLLRIKGIEDGQVEPGSVRKIDLDEVESVSSIVQRFATGAMSYGSISAEAHETLAIAMNRLGARSNTGEGGEDAARFSPDPNGDLRRSAVKQVASGRFGVTSEYLVNADDLQIKMAQGAKPGEGGQLPGHKVYPWIASTRYSTPGVGLISPPPHHDIYSIEDLAQLIHDLKNANPAARVHVKLVAEVGVGTVAAGVSKAHADVVLISGPRRRHRRRPADLAQAHRRALGARPGRDPADAAAQPAQGPDHGPGGRSAQDRPRRDHRGAARRGGVRVRVGAARGLRLHHDARLPPGHLPGRRRHSEPGAAQAVLRQAGVRGHLLRVHRRGGPRVPRGARPAVARGGRRPGRPARHRPRGLALEGGRTRPRSGAARAGLRRAAAPDHRAGPRPRPGARQHPHPAGRGRARRGQAGPSRAADPQRQPHRRHHARLRGDQAVGRRRAAAGHDRGGVHRVGGPVVRRVPAPRHHAPADRRRQRLPGQGAVGRAADRRARRRFAL